MASGEVGDSCGRADIYVLVNGERLDWSELLVGRKLRVWATNSQRGEWRVLVGKVVVRDQ